MGGMRYFDFCINLLWFLTSWGRIAASQVPCWWVPSPVPGAESTFRGRARGHRHALPGELGAHHGWEAPELAAPAEAQHQAPLPEGRPCRRSARLPQQGPAGHRAQRLTGARPGRAHAERRALGWVQVLEGKEVVVAQHAGCYKEVYSCWFCTEHSQVAEDHN